jgi:hypothetical protein
MKGKIPQLIDVSAGGDVFRTERSMDVCLICTFNDKAAHDAYQVHPAHLKVKEYVQSVKKESYCVDFEY